MCGLKRRREKVIDLKRNCKQNSKRRRAPGIIGPTITAVMLGTVALFIGSVAMAQDATAQAGAGVATPVLKIDTGDTAWVLTSTALVLAMTMPGLALFYGGLVRNKNVLGTIMHSAIILCMVSLIWILFGYSLAFGPDKGGIIGGLEWIGLNGVGSDPHPTYGPTIPHQVFMLFQLMFAAITPALITGAFAERMRFSSLLLFAALWSVVIYTPVAHWIWGGGWLGKMGALDFAGGAVVHISSGVGALICALVMGQRKGYGTEYMAPHNLPFTLLGTGLLWFGWFGFNAGSALGANGVAGSAFLATHTAAATAALVWMWVEWMHRGRPTVLGVASGAVAGLATVTPGAGFVGPFSAIVIGGFAGILCYFAVVWKGRMGYDDSLDVVGIHGVGGVFGILATGLFASKAINSAGADGLFFGNAAQFGIQAIMVAAVAIFSAFGTWIILRLVDAMVGLRVSPEDEATGLDLSQHNERAYS
jgi:ammonium transporter, Amt family